MRPRLAFALAFLLAPLAGCVADEPPAAAGEWRFGGSFTRDFTPDDVSAVCLILFGHDPCAMGKSLPPVYGRSFATKAECEAKRAEVLALPRVANVSACEAAVATTPAGTPTGTTPPATTTLPTQPAPGGNVTLTVDASRAAIRSGEPVDVTLRLRNGGATSLWTTRGFACGGTWDVRLLDAEGREVRIDDRDALGCPDGGPLQDEVRPGETIEQVYRWDGRARPQLGQTAEMPPGEYAVEASAAYGAREDALARGDELTTARAATRVVVQA